MRRVDCFVCAALLALFFLLQAAIAPSRAGDFKADDVRLGAFSTDARDWQTVVVDLGSSALVRIYGKIVTDAFPTDVTVGVSEHLSSVSAWIGDSGGSRIYDARRSGGAEGGDRYLVIEGRAASADLANGTSVRFVSYRADGCSNIQFLDIPVQPRAAAADPADGAGGCGVGSGLPGIVAALLLFALTRRARRVV